LNSLRYCISVYQSLIILLDIVSFDSISVDFTIYVELESEDMPMV